MAEVSATVILPRLSMVKALAGSPAVILKAAGSSPVVTTEPTAEPFPDPSEILNVWDALIAREASVTLIVTVSTAEAFVPSVTVRLKL